MRIMTKDETKLKITEHIILRNFWEYYVTDEKHSDDIVQCLVMGFETELGDVSLEEIRPYILTRTKKLEEVAAAPGWDWVN